MRVLQMRSAFLVVSLVLNASILSGKRCCCFSYDSTQLYEQRLTLGNMYNCRRFMMQSVKFAF